MIDIHQILAEQKQFFQSGRTKDLQFRLKSLARLKDAIIDNQAAILKALNQDLSKSTYEGYLSEVGVILNEIRLVSRASKPHFCCGWRQAAFILSLMAVL